MLLHAKLPWTDPLLAAAAATRSSAALGERYALLYSGAQHPHTGRFSYLALLPREELVGGSLAELQRRISAGGRRYDHAWFGYLGYALGAGEMEVVEGRRAFIAAPPMWMVRYRLLLVFDHHRHHIEVWTDDADAARALRGVDLAARRTAATAPAPAPLQMAPGRIDHIRSNMDLASYRGALRRVLEHIRCGDVYQANVTRKFFGSADRSHHPQAVFARLHARSPACYSALFGFGEVSLVSSSPERFLTVDGAGHANSRPIKGSAPRHADRDLDRASYRRLITSEKDRAENLMIVDLARNDLGRGCEIGSVVVDALYQVTSHPTIHHLSSSISGNKRADRTTVELIRDCFPPGSMTGAPKLRAMQICAELEQWQRGAYAGAAGWLGGDGSCDLSVVIRSIVLDAERFEFQVGGGIVHDSDIEEEWEETMTKARGVAAALGIDEARLRAL